MKKLLSWALYLVIVLLLIIPSNTFAQSTSTQLKQVIKPIECTFTRTIIVNDETTNSVCTDQNAPTLETASSTASGKPKLTGTMPVGISKIKMFRIWIASSWYTYNISPLLSISNNTWLLDLSDRPLSLPPGDYTIIIELVTTDSILLRSVYESALSILKSIIVETITDNGVRTTVYRYIPSAGIGYIVEAPIDSIPPQNPNSDNLSGGLKKLNPIDINQLGYIPVLLSLGAVIAVGAALVLLLLGRKRQNDRQL